MISADRIKRLAPSARADLVQAILDNWEYAERVGQITTPRRVRRFMTEICVETGGLKSIEEDLSYRAARIREVWPSRFKTVAAAKPYERNPKALALKVYSGRNGNRPGTDDGWTYRGSGFMQNTGRNNFRLAGYENDPDALRTPGPGFRAAVDYWSKHNLNRFADADNLVGLRKAINGGTHGLEDAKAYDARARKIWPDSMTPPKAQRPAPAPAPKPKPAGPTSAEIEFVQRRLREIGYFEVGEVDGKFGSRTRGALLAFKADHGLPLTADIDDKTKLRLLHAGQRPVSYAREHATASDLEDKSETVAKAQETKRASFWTLITTAAGAVISGVSSFLGDAAGQIAPVRDFIPDIPAWVWFATVAIIAFGLWRASGGIVDRVVADYRQGKKL
jgi:predicted chitinase